MEGVWGEVEGSLLVEETVPNQFTFLLFWVQGNGLVKYVWRWERWGPELLRLAAPPPPQLSAQLAFFWQLPRKGTPMVSESESEYEELTCPYFECPRAQPSGTWLVPGSCSAVAMVTSEVSAASLPFQFEGEEGGAPAPLFGGVAEEDFRAWRLSRS